MSFLSRSCVNLLCTESEFLELALFFLELALPLHLPFHDLLDLSRRELVLRLALDKRQFLRCQRSHHCLHLDLSLFLDPSVAFLK